MKLSYEIIWGVFLAIQSAYKWQCFSNCIIMS